MSTHIKIAIAEPSPIIRSGLEVQLKRLARYKVHIEYLVTEDLKRDWTESLALVSADIFILNPLLCGLMPQQLIAGRPERAKCVALSYGTTHEALLKEYDDILCVTDSVRQIGALFDRLIQPVEEISTPNEPNTLTPRERDILVGIVKGQTNKEIASELHLSPHTVITHRRNITKKLGIHSSSGLTIYAMMHKLVEFDDIKH